MELYAARRSPTKNDTYGAKNKNDAYVSHMRRRALIKSGNSRFEYTNTLDQQSYHMCQITYFKKRVK